MMRTLVLATTALFWLVVGGFAWDAWRGGEAPDSAASPPSAGSPAASAPASAAATATDGATRRISRVELARHDRADDCWLAIDGAVYDLSGYVPRHPAEPEVLTVWCGREATQAYRTKGLPGTGRPHSARADAMLPRYRVGTLDAPR